MQYNFVTGTTAASAQVNSDYYKLYNDVNAAITALNSCTYAPGLTMTAVTANAPISGSLSACSPGTGETLTLGFSAVGLTMNAAQWNATTSEAAPLGSFTQLVASAQGVQSMVLPVWIKGFPYTGLANAHEEWISIAGGAGTYNFTKAFDNTPVCVGAQIAAVSTTQYSMSANGSGVCAGN